MTFTIEAKPLEVKVKVPGYGTFSVCQMGAGVQADINDRIDELERKNNETKEQYADVFKKEEELTAANDTAGLAELRKRKDYKAAVTAMQQGKLDLLALTRYVDRCWMNLWRSDDPDALARFLGDFTADQIRALHAQAMGHLNG